MKKWVRLGIIFSIIIIVLRYIITYIISKSININNVEESTSALLPIISFPPPFSWAIILISIIIGFGLGFLISLFSKKKRK